MYGFGILANINVSSFFINILEKQVQNTKSNSSIFNQLSILIKDSTQVGSECTRHTDTLPSFSSNTTEDDISVLQVSLSISCSFLLQAVVLLHEITTVYSGHVCT